MANRRSLSSRLAQTNNNNPISHLSTVSLIEPASLYYSSTSDQDSSSTSGANRKTRTSKETIEFIIQRASEGLSDIKIKRELDLLLKHDSPCLRTVGKFTSRFKTIARGQAVDPNAKLSSLIDEKYRKLIEKGVHDGKSVTQVREELWNMYGRNSVSEVTIRSWHHRFRLVAETQLCNNHVLEDLNSSNVNRELMESDVSNNDDSCALVKQEVLIDDSPLSVLESNQENSSGQILTVADMLETNEQSADEEIHEETRGGDEDRRGGGFERGLELERILGDFMKDGVRWFLVKWKNCLAKDLGMV